MLTKFAVKNFRGFEDWIEWDLTKSQKFQFNDFAVKDGVIKNAIIYGPNGAGKSNFSMAMFDIVRHLTRLFVPSKCFENYACGLHPNDPVEFKYSFKFGDDTVDYSYKKDQLGTLLEERLDYNGDKALSVDDDGPYLRMDYFHLTKFPNFNISSAANRPSFISYLLASIPMAEDHFLIKMQKFVSKMLWFRSLDDRQFIGLTSNPEDIEKIIIDNGLYLEFAEFLKVASGQDFDIIAPQEGDSHLYYKVGPSKLPLYKTASTGTRALFVLFYWLKRASGPSLIFIDEFDAFYHYKLSLAVCKTLFKLDAQVFLSSHNTYLMTNDLLRPDCNFILNHGKLKALSESTDKELRQGHNIEKLYRGGAFEI